ncbi:MAG: hypothetical protein WBW94_15315 [Anaerolineales bacterium]
MSTIICPQCNNDDSIQRVSAVVAGGTSTGSFSGPTGALTYSDGKVGSAGGYTTLRGGSTTNLAKMLKLPPKPRTRSSALISIMFCVLLLTWWYVCWGLAAGAGITYSESCFYPVTIIMVIVAISIIYSNNKNNKSINSIEKPNWENFKKKWEQLYYCYKHGIVFDPETNKTCEHAQIKEFVNELIKDQIIKPQSTTGVSH